MTVDVTTISVAQFEAQFFRDFPYLDAITYNAQALYNTGAEVYYPTTQLFYCALVDGITGIAPNSDATKWQKTPDNIANYIQDQDITNAFTEAQVLFNQGLFGSDGQITLAYLYLTAHFLCNDIRASQAGIASTAQMPVQSRSVGSVSETYGIPEQYLKSPTLAFYGNSAYGLKYVQMALPKLIGNMAALCADANP